MSKTLILADDVNHPGPVTDVFESAEGSRMWTIVDPGEVSEFTEEGSNVKEGKIDRFQF